MIFLRRRNASFKLSEAYGPDARIALRAEDIRHVVIDEDRSGAWRYRVQIRVYSPGAEDIPLSFDEKFEDVVARIEAEKTK